MLTEEILKKNLGTTKFGQKIYTFETIDSTNNCAKALASCWAPEGTIVIAEEQTAGRGRLGRTWQAERGKNLTFSLVLRPAMPPEIMNTLPLLAAVAIADAVHTVTGLSPECKWPNDLLLGGKKCCGILLEGVTKQQGVDFVVIGIGINVNQSAFPDEIREKATSLANAFGKEIDRVELFREIVRTLESRYDALAKKGIPSLLAAWAERATMFNKQIVVDQHGTLLHGTALGLSPDGGLIILTDSAEQVVYAGDVSIVG